MRKVLLIAIGLASFGALASVQPAFAEKKTICQIHSGFFLGKPTHCTNQAEAAKYDCKVTLVQGGTAIKECFTVDGPPTPTTPWQGSAAGVNKAFSPSTAYKNK